MHSITLSGVSYAWPGDDRLLMNISFSVGRGIYALAGANGAGKTTLLRLIAGELKPSTGSINCATTPQWISQIDYADKHRGSGERQMLMMEAALAPGSGLILLDEPERHLDSQNRKRLMLRFQRFGGTILFATHDAELLQLAKGILHLERESVRLYTMSFSAYEQAIAAERAEREYAQKRAEAKVKQALAAAERNLIRQLKRERIATLKAPDAGIPRVARGIMKRNAEETRGKIIRRSHHRIQHSQEELRRLRAANKVQAQFSFAPDKTAYHAARLDVVNLNFGLNAQRILWPKDLSFSARAGERLRIAGLNGYGKSLFFAGVCGRNPLPYKGRIERNCRRLVLIDQNYIAISGAASLFDLAHENFPNRSEGEIRRMLGGYGFWGQTVFRSFDSLSTGERVRLLVFLFSKADTPPDLLIADEAETGLDRESRALLARFFSEYPGLLLFATHSEAFAEQVNPTRCIELNRV